MAGAPLISTQFKEAFSMLDKQGKGHINEQDLTEMWVSLGQPKSQAELKAMMASMPQLPGGGVSFTAYFASMSALLTDMSSREELVELLASFDEGHGGKIDVAELREALTSGYDALTDAEVDRAIKGYTRAGQFNYQLFVEALAGSAQ
ncbi:calmodulin [Protomyces lactucae-debilis]|uniref:Calmodulin n=1 Tax=Protomyces lactucae-debilis TaxID=2754530 RepID=A0A1Y2F6B3_PROLT|nr:calmodulin [Protomyces lactucae-debilis]ORY79413.1 calmodulin [Protomyces lactucae-debilis]